MTNAMIIFWASCKLMEDGVIGTTGRSCEIEDAEGNKRVMMEPEPIHTYAHWKKLGYQVKRGEKNIAEIMIWKAGKGKSRQESDEEQLDGENPEVRMFRKTAFFFKMSQCEKIAG